MIHKLSFKQGMASTREIKKVMDIVNLKRFNSKWHQKVSIHIVIQQIIESDSNSERNISSLYVFKYSFNFYAGLIYLKYY